MVLILWVLTQKNTLKKFSKCSWWLQHVLDTLGLCDEKKKFVEEAHKTVALCQFAFCNAPPGVSLGASAATLFVARRAVQSVAIAITAEVQQAVVNAKFPGSDGVAEVKDDGPAPLVSSKPPAGLSKAEKKKWHLTKMVPVTATPDTKRGRGSWYNLSKRQKAVKQLTNTPKVGIFPNMRPVSRMVRVYSTCFDADVWQEMTALMCLHFHCGPEWSVTSFTTNGVEIHATLRKINSMAKHPLTAQLASLSGDVVEPADNIVQIAPTVIVEPTGNVAPLNLPPGPVLSSAPPTDEELKQYELFHSSRRIFNPAVPNFFEEESASQQVEPPILVVLDCPFDAPGDNAFLDHGGQLSASVALLALHTRARLVDAFPWRTTTGSGELSDEDLLKALRWLIFILQHRYKVVIICGKNAQRVPFPWNKNFVCCDSARFQWSWNRGLDNDEPVIIKSTHPSPRVSGDMATNFVQMSMFARALLIEGVEVPTTQGDLSRLLTFQLARESELLDYSIDPTPANRVQFVKGRSRSKRRKRTKQLKEAQAARGHSTFITCDMGNENAAYSLGFKLGNQGDFQNVQAHKITKRQLYSFTNVRMTPAINKERHKQWGNQWNWKIRRCRGWKPQVCMGRFHFM